MKKLTASLLMVAATCAFSVSALASDQSGIPTFELLDADRNGFITSEEAACCDALISEFETFDANQDGKLDQAEYASFSVKAEQQG